MASARQPLAGLREGAHGIIDAIPFEDAVDDFAALRLLPGEAVEVVQVIPLGGPLLIRTRSGFYALGRQVAEKVWVRA